MKISIIFLIFISLVTNVYSDTNPFIPGDVNNDKIIDLADAILSFKAITNINLEKNVYKEADINNDNRLGLAETIYIITQLSRGFETADNINKIFCPCDINNITDNLITTFYKNNKLSIEFDISHCVVSYKIKKFGQSIIKGNFLLNILN